MTVTDKELIFVQRDADDPLMSRMLYFTRWRKERRYLTETEAREKLAAGEAMVCRIAHPGRVAREMARIATEQHDMHVMDWHIDQFRCSHNNALPDLRGLRVNCTAEKASARSKREPGALLPKIYKSERFALAAAEEFQRTSPLEGAMRWLPVRCVGTKEDTEPFVPEMALRGEYRWRLRRTFK